MKKKYRTVIFSILAVFLLVLTVTTTQNAMAADAKTQQEKKSSSNTSEQSQTAGEYIDDSVVTATVKSKILGEKGLSSMNISVKTQDGVVTLSGTTDTAEHAQLAERVAKLVNGVKRVVNDLKVDGKKSQSAGEYMDDAAITTAVKANILKEKGLSSLDISVKTQEGVVTLSGTTGTAEHSQLAERVTKQAKGVKRVVNDLKVDGKKSQSAGEYMDDAAITTAVKANILKEKGLSSMDISVKTQEGVVTLSGTTGTAEHSQLAERVTKQAKGVKQVVNELRVK